MPWCNLGSCCRLYSFVNWYRHPRATTNRDKFTIFTSSIVSSAFSECFPHRVLRSYVTEWSVLVFSIKSGACFRFWYKWVIPATYSIYFICVCVSCRRTWFSHAQRVSLESLWRLHACMHGTSTRFLISTKLLNIILAFSRRHTIREYDKCIHCCANYQENLCLYISGSIKQRVFAHGACFPLQTICWETCISWEVKVLFGWTCCA